MAKRILTKEKTDRQLAGQSTSTLFMSMKGSYGHDKRTVLFDNQSVLKNKIDQPKDMIIKLTIQSSNQGRPFKHQVYQRKRRGHGRSNHYDTGRQGTF